jgi:predicted phosphoribosyltransferase
MTLITNYFESREQAGQILAQKLAKYRYEDVIVLALSEGGVMIGAEIAKSLHALIAMLLTKDVYLPDGRTLMGVVNEQGGFVYNDAFSSGEIEEFESEYHETIQTAKFNALHELHVALGQGGILSKEYFRNRVVICVSDNAFNGLAFNIAYDFLKTIKVNKVVMVTPVATVQAVDKMHVLADEIDILSVTEFPQDVNHYYSDTDVLDHHEIIETLNDIVLQWRIEDDKKKPKHNPYLESVEKVIKVQKPSTTKPATRQVNRALLDK